MGWQRRDGMWNFPLRGKRRIQVSDLLAYLLAYLEWRFKVNSDEKKHLKNSFMTAGKDLLCGFVTVLFLYIIAWTCKFNPEWQWAQKIIDELKTPSIISFLSPFYTLVTISITIFIIFIQNDSEDKFTEIIKKIKNSNIKPKEQDAILGEIAQSIMNEIENYWTYKPTIATYLYYLGIFLISSIISTTLSEWSFSVFYYFIPIFSTHMINTLLVLTIPKYPNHKLFRKLTIILFLIAGFSTLYFLSSQINHFNK